MAGILANFYVTIYNALYHPTEILDVFKEYNGYLDTVLASETFSTAYFLIRVIGIGFMVLVFMLQIGDKISSGDYSLEVLFRELLKLFITYILILNSKTIFQYLLDWVVGLMGSIENLVTIHVEAELDILKMKWGIKQLSILKQIMYLLLGILPYLFAVLLRIIIVVMAVSRLLELSVRVIAAPLAYAGNVFGGGENSEMVRYMKRCVGLLFQIVVIVAVWFAMIMVKDAMMGTTSSLNPGASESIEMVNPSSTLVDGTYEYRSSGEEYEVECYTKESIEKFLDSVAISDDFIIGITFMLASIFILVKSREIGDSLFT